MGGGSQTTNQSQQGTSSSVNSLPPWLTGPFQNSLAGATGLYNAGMGATSAGPQMLGQGMSAIGGVNPQSIGAADTGITNMINGAYMGPGQSQMNAANPQISALASGQYMDPSSNPYLQQSYNLGLQGIQNNVDSQFGAAGRNVLAGAPVQADQASTLASQLYGGQYDTNLAAMQGAQGLASSNYNTGVGQIGSAASLAPGITSGLYTQGNQLLNAGMTPFNTQSWYSGLLGQTAAPFGQNNGTSTGSVTNNTSMSQNGFTSALGLISALGGLAGGISKLPGI